MTTADAFADELVALRPRLMRLARRLFYEPAAAEDLLQHTMLRAWRFRDRYQPGTSMLNWACTIMRREHAKILRSAMVRNTVPLDLMLDHHQPVVAPTQEDRVAFAEVSGRIDRMDPMYRDTLLMVAVGASEREVMAATNVTLRATVASRVRRGRELLAEAMA